MPIYINKQQWIPAEEFPSLAASCGGHPEDPALRRAGKARGGEVVPLNSMDECN